ncbi:MAG: peptide deformylase [Bacteroidota bacterium]
MRELKDVLQLGNPLLYQVSEPIKYEELDLVKNWVEDLHHVMEEIRRIYNFGRAIAAPQLGIMKRLIYMNIDRPVVFINPEIISKSEAMFELWDDCMSFPNLLVKVRRHKDITLRYRDEKWKLKEWKMKNDLSELLQHEYDEGIL